MKISLISAIDENYGIGKNNQLLCSLTKDLKWFKEKTSGYPIVMGRKTYEQIYSIFKKPLPNRMNIVLSSQTEKKYQNLYDIKNNFYFFQNQDDILQHLQDQSKIFIIGGASIYQLFLPIADELIITKIHQQFEADSYFPKWNEELFKEIFYQKEEEKDIYFSFHIYQKKIDL